MRRERTHSVVTIDGVPLAASTFEGERARAVLVVNSAMATRRRVYRPLALYLARMGLHVVTWDYRGIGDSAPSSLANMKATIEDWGTHDADAIIEFARERYPGLPVVVLGHSMGGQILGMAYRSIHADAFITVATQSGYWRFYRGLFGLYVAWMWFVQIPLLSRLFGYYPGRWLGLGMDVPAGAARQWARWGRDPDYLAGRHAAKTIASYAEIDQPMLSVWIADDHVAPRAAHEAMMELYSGAQHHHYTLHPEDLGLEKIGHFGFFRPHVGNIAWPKLLLWIERVTGRNGRGGSGSRYDRAA